MGEKFVATGSGTVGASPGKTLLALTTSTTRRGALYDVMCAFNSPADNAIQIIGLRKTAAGTEGAAVTPQNLDPLGPASGLTAGENHSAEPTYTAASEWVDEELYQRTWFRWVAAYQGAEIKTNLTTAHGLGLRTIHASATPTGRATFMWEE